MRFPQLRDLFSIFPKAGREPRKVRRAERRGLRDARAHDRHAQKIA